MTDKGLKRIVLVVEGIPTLAHVILDALTRDDFACKVVLKHEREEALDYLLGRGAYRGQNTYYVMPCVTLLDLSLPNRDGLQMLREMRAHERTKLLPVVAFTSADEQQEAGIVYASGANSYIHKTPGFNSFIGALRQVAHYWCVLNQPPPTTL